MDDKNESMTDSDTPKEFRLEIGDSPSYNHLVNLAEQNSPGTGLFLTSGQDILLRQENSLAVTTLDNIRTMDNDIYRLTVKADETIKLGITNELSYSPYVLNSIGIESDGIYIKDTSDYRKMLLAPYETDVGVSLKLNDSIQLGIDYAGNATLPLQVNTGLDAKSLYVTPQENVLDIGSTKLFITGADDLVLKPNHDSIVLNTLTHLGLDSSFIRINEENRLCIDISSAGPLAINLAGKYDFAGRTNSVLNDFRISDIGKAFDCDASIRIATQDSFLSLSDSYSGLYRIQQNDIASILSVPAGVSTLLPSEYYLGGELARAVSVPDLSSVPDKLIEYRTIVQDATRKAMQALDPELTRMLDGARECLDSTNPDRVRHFTTSLRELFTHVLHRLSPDSSLSKWSSEPSHFNRGRPTRKARLKYICREVDVGALTEFIQTDIDDVLTFTSLFQSGTHSVTPQFTEQQLRAMLVRMEGVVRLLIEIGTN